MKDVGTAGVSFIIPVSQSRYVPLLANCLASIKAQNHCAETFFEYVLVYIYRKGEEETIDELSGLFELVCQYGATLVSYEHELEDYPLALARNVGARRSTRRFLAFVDADIVLDPKTIPACMDCVPRAGGAAHCLVYRMPEEFGPSSNIFRPDQIWKEFRKNREKGKLDLDGRGGFLYITRELFFYMRGYDEDFVGWGGEDTDMHQRLDNHFQHLPGSRTVHLSTNREIFGMHQWHPHKPDYKRFTNRNRKLLGSKLSIVRNDHAFWGGVGIKSNK